MVHATHRYHPSLSLTYGCSPIAAGQVENTPLHSDEFHRIVFVVSGDVTATSGSGAAYGSARQHAGQGVIFYRKNQPHSQMNHLSVPYERYYLDFDEALFGPLPEVCPPLSEMLSGNSFFLPLTKEAFEELFATVRAILRLCDTPVAEDAAERPDPLWEIRMLFSAFLLRVASLRRERRMPGKYIPYIESVMNYMGEYYTEKITIERLTEEFHVSRGKLTADFKAATTVTVNDYLTAVRLDRAIHFLLDGHSVTETALLCGFATAEYFISVFRAHNGTTPKQFSQLCGGNQLSLEWEYWD